MSETIHVDCDDLRTLAMDSAAPLGSMALLAGERLLAREYFQGTTGHGVALAESLARLLTATAFSCADLDLIAVTHGPGSFAGLRIALGYAKGMALARGTPVVGVSTLDWLAAGTGEQQGWISVVMDARRGEIFAALYHLERGHPRRHLAPATALTPQHWAATLAAQPALQQEPLCLTGTGLLPYGADFRRWLPLPYTTTPAETWNGDPFLLGLLGQQKFYQQRPNGPTMPTLLDYQRQPDAKAKQSVP
ncbi:MAG: tRNA (adenosine(37)-N6)-threonylcarbamoyltransferase complex dimerization subunit type 1 TsaB [Magnetococcales bacterium]|nr:tRNA (adenosine(37)-N6)-threonylcarbamoyltransferase complex dimerization subunit type 1 TsaB [Magnetococcales bacterium]